jgi:redox-sensing transcriptional repressor
LYRRILSELAAEGGRTIASHALAERAGGTAAQVRRDLMSTGCVGKPNRGYAVPELLAALHAVLDTPGGQRAVLVGLGNLGRALLAHFTARRREIEIVAALDADPRKSGRAYHGCPCYRPDQTESVVRDKQIKIAVLAVPAEAAQLVADELARCGVRAFLNFAPTPLQTPDGIHVENVDLTMSLEKVAFYAREGSTRRNARKT